MAAKVVLINDNLGFIFYVADKMAFGAGRWMLEARFEV